MVALAARRRVQEIKVKFVLPVKLNIWLLLRNRYATAVLMSWVSRASMWLAVLHAVVWSC